MIFHNFQPGSALQNFVKTYHLRHFEFSAHAKIPLKAFSPRAEQYITFYVRGGETIQYARNGTTSTKNTTSITGQNTQMVYRHVTPQFLIIQVPFFPGALFQLTGIPFHEFRDGSVELECIYPNETREVDQKLQDAISYPQMIKIVDDFLTDLFLKKAKITNRPFDKILPFLCQSHSISGIDRLADQACLSVRQFERLSQNYFGVGPKTMSRIARFSTSYIMRTKHPEYTWLDVAMACGYEDYQHMVRDYRDFAGITPNQLWEKDLRAPDRVLGLR